MTTDAPSRLLTAEEFWELPDSPHGGKMELVCGRVVRHMPVGGTHGQVAVNLATDLNTWVRRYRLGRVGAEVGFLLSRNPDLVRAPDVHFVRAERLIDGRMPPRFFDGPPDLAIEVTSPGDSDDELQEKVAQYLSARTPRVWIVRPGLTTVTVHRTDGTARTLSGDDTLTSDDAHFQVEGFGLRVADIFA